MSRFICLLAAFLFMSVPLPAQTAPESPASPKVETPKAEAPKKAKAKKEAKAKGQRPSKGMEEGVSMEFWDEEGRTTHGPWVRPGIVFLRGLLNLAALPLELPRTMIREARDHPRTWPISFIPRTFTHWVLRISSAANDLLFFPWIAPFTDDLSPWTEPMGLSDYPWQLD